MRFKLIFYAILSVCFVEHIQAQWNWQLPLPQGNTLSDVAFMDSSQGWAVGEYGTIIHTTTGGTSWYEQEFSRTDNVTAISMVSFLEGWSVGDNGIILHTTDGGDDWNEQSSGVSTGLNAVVFLDSLNGWAAGDNEIILHTSNGGTTWTTQHQSAVHLSINAITFVSPTEGWAAGANQTIFHTTDGGTTWTPRVIGTTASAYASIYFVGTSLGFITGSGGVIVRTTDSGTTWAEVTSGVTAGLNHIVMQNSFVGWIVGDGGVFLKTINGGSSWSTASKTPGEDLNGVSYLSGKLWIAGEFGRILKSTNSGFSWTSLDEGSRLSTNWIDAVTPSIAVAVGQTGLIERTTDGGSTWNMQTSPVPSISCYGVKFIDANHGWAVGDDGTILRTSDGGTWSVQASPISHTFFGISFASPSLGWIVGGEFVTYTGAMLRTTDGGNSWSTPVTGLSNILYGIAFASGTDGWAVGENGFILHTSNGGSSWNPQSSGTTKALFWCSFTSTTNGWAVGDSGIVLHTVNGGTTWTKQNTGTGELLYSVSTPSSAHVIASGDLGTVLESFDGGAHWQNVYSRTQNSLFGIIAPNDTTSWACGDYGTILRYSTPDQNFGTVSGKVYDDANNNASYDAGELGITGWKVILSGIKTDSVLSGSDGSFLFTRLPMGPYTLKVVVQPPWTQTQPVSPSFYSIQFDSSATTFNGMFGNYSASEFGFPVRGQWNLLSLPLTVDDPRKTTLYPTASSSAFAYSDHYYILDSVRHGLGYWVQYSANQTIWISGSPIFSDTIPLLPGWNLVGSVSDSIPANALTTIPAGILSPNIYSYNGSYTVVSKIYGGKGHWVKSSQSGTLILQHSGANASAQHVKSSRDELTTLNSLTISDASGNSHTVYFDDATSTHISPEDYALPPLPPPGSFDVRFEHGEDVTLFQGSSSAGISIQSIHYPLTVRWNVQHASDVRYTLTDGPSGTSIATLGTSGSITIPSPSVTKIFLRSSTGGSLHQIPTEYSLEQNNPNPFNPSTRIAFALPKNSIVHLTIYSVVGQIVAKLIDGELDAGFHSVEWSPALASGLYFYRLEAISTDENRTPFTSTKKMLLLK